MIQTKAPRFTPALYMKIILTEAKRLKGQHLMRGEQKIQRIITRLTCMTMNTITNLQVKNSSLRLKAFLHSDGAALVRSVYVEHVAPRSNGVSA